MVHSKSLSSDCVNGVVLFCSDRSIVFTECSSCTVRSFQSVLLIVSRAIWTRPRQNALRAAVSKDTPASLTAHVLVSVVGKNGVRWKSY